MELKKTPFYQKHLENNGRMVDFGGWSLPVEYQSILKEARAVRATCGLFDASHMGEIRIKGKKALEFLQKVVSNDLSQTKPGQLQYNLFINPQGGVIDDLMVYNFGPQEYLCVVNASNIDKDYEWLCKNKIEGAEIIDESSITALLPVQGPNAVKLLGSAFGKKLSQIKYMNFSRETVSGKELIFSRSGYTGEDGFEIYMPAKDALDFWDMIIDKGKKFGLVLCGLGARDILRIEAGYPLYGHEINDETNPLEASLSWAVKFSKDFIGKEAILHEKKEGLKKKRVGFIMEEKIPPRQGYAIYHQDKPAGVVCSGTYSPNAGKSVGMAYVVNEYAASGSHIQISVRDRLYQAKITQYPFVKLAGRG